MESNIQQDMNALIKRRHEELEELKKGNHETYAYSYEVDNYSKTIKDNFETLEGKDVAIAGRIMAIRRMGKASFTHLMDKDGRIQIYLKKDEIGEEAYNVFKLLDIGDIIGAAGYVFKTKTGETSVHVKSIKLLAKSIRPIPIAKETTDEQGNKVIHDQFTDKELRYRQRYVDLIVNPEVKEVFILRSKIVTSLRRFLDEKGYFEITIPAEKDVTVQFFKEGFITFLCYK